MTLIRRCFGAVVPGGKRTLEPQLEPPTVLMSALAARGPRMAPSELPSRASAVEDSGAPTRECVTSLGKREAGHSPMAGLSLIESAAASLLSLQLRSATSAGSTAAPKAMSSESADRLSSVVGEPRRGLTPAAERLQQAPAGKARPAELRTAPPSHSQAASFTQEWDRMPIATVKSLLSAKEL